VVPWLATLDAELRVYRKAINTIPLPRSFVLSLSPLRGIHIKARHRLGCEKCGANGFEVTCERKSKMRTMFLNICIKLQNLVNREEGQDLVEYALVVALIAFGATAGMSQLAQGLNTAFINISTTLGSYTS
jgi:pilus assembly protein Flp/PilA